MNTGTSEVYLFKKLIALLMALMFFALQAKGSERVLLVTEYDGSRLIKENSFTNLEGETVIKPDTYLMKFQVIEVLHSDAPFKEAKIQVEMDIHSVVPFTMNKKQVLVLKIEDDRYSVLGWSFVGELFCIKNELVPISVLDEYFPSPQKGDEGKVCRFL